MTATFAWPAIVAHDGGPLLPHDALTAWNLDPFIVVPLAISGWLYWRGWRPTRDGSTPGYAMLAALVTVVIALLSPIDAIGGFLLSGHMVQHVLLTAVAAPLIAWAAPGVAILRGTPVPIRRRLVSTRRRTGIDATVISQARSPIARWLLLVSMLWLWHSSVLYGLAIRNDVVHALEHVSFLGAAVLFWTVIIGPVRARLAPGAAILAVFTLTLQGIVLSMLLTFSPIVWYDAYADAAPGWGLEPLADQQLAGVIMWVPTGFIHTGILLAILLRWLSAIDDPTVSVRSAITSAHVTTPPRVRIRPDSTAG